MSLLRVSIWVLAAGMLAGAIGFPTPSVLSSSVQPVALIGSDDRQQRMPGDAKEEAQGRAWCYDSGPSVKIGRAPSKRRLQSGGFAVANATLAFESNVAVVNRHLFKDALGNDIYGPEKCYFEHILSGVIIAITAVEFPQVEPDSFIRGSLLPNARYQSGDFAVVRLASTPSNSAFLTKDEIVTGAKLQKNTELKVVSNYAFNRQKKAQRTKVLCRRERFFNLDGMRSNVYSTSCDTGSGSSGSQVYAKLDGQWKWVGVIVGENERKSGSSYEVNFQETVLTVFDDRLIEAYERLQSRPDTRE